MGESFKRLEKSLRACDEKLKETKSKVKTDAEKTEMEHGARQFAHSDFQGLQRNSAEHSADWESFSKQYVETFCDEDVKPEALKTQRSFRVLAPSSTSVQSSR